MVSQHALQVSKGESPGPHSGGVEGTGRGGVLQPTPEGVSQHALRQIPSPRGRYASYWNAFLSYICFKKLSDRLARCKAEKDEAERVANSAESRYNNYKQSVDRKLHVSGSSNFFIFFYFFMQTFRIFCTCNDPYS